MWLHYEVKTLGDIPRHYASVAPDTIALVDSAGQSTFAELDQRSNQIANLLLDMGVGETDHVSILSKNTAVSFELLFGVSKIGATLLPLNWRLAEPELAAIMADASPVLLIADMEYERAANAIVGASEKPCSLLLFDRMVAGSGDFGQRVSAADSKDPALLVNPLQPVILMYTSGSTGQPKGVMQTHHGHLMTRLCEHLDTAIVYRPGDVMLTVMPLFHAMGLGLSLQALYNGAAVVAYPMPEPLNLVRLIEQYKPTILPIVPTVIQMILHLPVAMTADFSSLRTLLYAASPIEPKLLTKALSIFDCDFVQFYGATETTVEVTFLRAVDHRSGDIKRLKSVGSPLPLVEIKAVDIHGNEVAPGEVGEFLIRTPTMSAGYRNQAALSFETFKSGWYRSGDAGYVDEDGFCYLVDRVKDMIISGGENVYSTEVEHALSQHPAVEMCAVFGLPDERWGERVTAAVVIAPGYTATSIELIDHCRRLIAGYKVPKQVELVDVLPMTASGKIAKPQLRRIFSEEGVTSAD